MGGTASAQKIKIYLKNYASATVNSQEATL